jgi:hypothetical protein
VRAWLAIAVVGCGATAPPPVAVGPGAASPGAASSGAPSSGAPSPADSSPAAQPHVAQGVSANQAPADSWHVELGFDGWVARASALAVDATGVYVTGPVFGDGNEDPRWAIAKLDRMTGAPLWTVFDKGGGAGYLAVRDGVLIVGGHTADNRTAIIERRDPATGSRLWRHVLGSELLGGISLTATSVLYASTDQQSGRITAHFGELSLDAGTIVHQTHRSSRRGRHIVRDGTSLYLIGDDPQNHFTLEKVDLAWKPVSTHAAGQLLRLAPVVGGVVAWFTTIEKYTAAGTRAWTSPLTGVFTDVTLDATGIYVVTMRDPGKNPDFALARLDPATGAIAWSVRTAEYSESRPSAAIAIDASAIYIAGYVGNRWFVERRRKTDGAIAGGKPAIHALPTTNAPQLAR